MPLLDDLANDLSPKKIVKDSVEGCLDAGVKVAKVGIKAAMAVHDATRGESITGLHIRDHLSGRSSSSRSSSGHSFTGLHLRSRFFG